MKFNIHKNDHELNNHYEIRKKIITYFNPKNKNDLIYFENLSHIFINLVFLKCNYNKKTELLIYNLIKNMKNNNIIKLLPVNYSLLKVSELKNILKKKKITN